MPLEKSHKIYADSFKRSVASMMDVEPIRFRPKNHRSESDERQMVRQLLQTYDVIWNT